MRYYNNKSVGMVKQPTAEPSEFTMSSEDFPALPGTRNTGGPSSVVGGGSVVGSSAGTGGPVVSSAPSVVGSSGSTIVGAGVVAGGPPGGASSTASSGISGVVGSGVSMGTGGGCSVVGSSLNDKGTVPSSGPGVIGPISGIISVTGLSVTELVEVHTSNRASGAEKPFTIVKRGIQTSPDGKVTNIPSSMVKDQFGMVGLLTFIRAAETDPNLVSLALGQDLTALGLNLNSPDNLYPNFGGPWAETPCRPQDIDFHVPPEYLINQTIREKLAPVKLNRYKDDLLFYMFYTNVGDVLQMAAAAELYTREWRYHMEEKVWITQAPGLGAVEKTSTYERGTYFFFDAQTWRKVPKDFHLDYNKLEGRPHLPQAFLPAAQPQVV